MDRAGRIKSMSQKLAQLFKEIRQNEPPLALETVVLRRIEAAEDQKMHWKLAFSRLVSIVSGLAALTALATLGNEFLHSEFASMFSLVFSDLGTITQNWHDFGLSLLETFPTMTAGIILLPLFTLFISLGSYLELHNHPRHKYV